jgi:hypothetical protein
MPLRYVLDEHLRGPLWNAIQAHNAAGTDSIDVVRVGDPPDLPCGTPDPDILLWAEREGRLLVTRDVNTVPGHLANHLAAGRHSPGVLIVRRGGVVVPQVVFALVLIADAGDPTDYVDCYRYIP